MIDRTKQSFIYSTIFHLLIFLMIAMLKVQQLPTPVSEYIEIVFPDTPVVERMRMDTGSSAPPPATEEIVTAEITPPTSPVAPPTQQIEIPEVTHTDTEVIPDWDFTGQRPNRPGFNAPNTPLDQMTPIHDPQTIAHNTPTQTTGNTTGTGVNPLSETFGDPTGIYSGSYQMEGDVVNRHIITKPLPVFPENIRQSGTVTLRFDVIPNGSVQNIRIDRQSNVPEFNVSAQNALRNWRFNESTRTHEGVITFNFRLN